MQGHQWCVDRGRDDRQVEVVKHDVDILMDASVEAKVQTQRSTTDALERTGPRPWTQTKTNTVIQLLKVFTRLNP